MTAKTPIDRLLAIMERLRDPERGCEWDVAQSFNSIAPYTIEEAYEVADAIERNDLPGLKDELGDLLLQVVFHAQIAQEAGLFAFDDVATSIADKMERRHPHIFGAATSDGHHLWETVKAQERATLDDRSALAGVARALPALMRAEKIGGRAARVGFDWQDAEGARDKVAEELAEVMEAHDQDARTEEVGDLLLAVTSLARHLSVDPEAALRAATDKFERRFRTMEATSDTPLTGLDAEGLDRLWRTAKESSGR